MDHLAVDGTGKDEPMSLTRVAGAAGAVVTVVAAVVFAGAVVTTQGVIYRGYVSEAGVPGQPHVSWYRWGIYLVAAALLLLAIGLYPLAAVAAGLVFASAVLGALSGSVSCSPGCPLPPYESPTARDLVHGGASTIGVGLTALAVLVIACRRRPGRLRQLCRAFLWVLVPVGATMTFALLFLGRGWTVGVTERTLLITILAWMAAAGVVIARGEEAATT